MQEYNYTLSSIDPMDYSIIKANLIGPSTELMEFIVTNLTTMCLFHVLTHKDYISIKIEGKTHRIYMYDFSEMNKESLRNLLRDQCMNDIVFSYRRGDKLTMSSPEPFSIEDMSYNLNLLTGFYNIQFPIVSETEYGHISSFNHKKITKFTTSDFLEIDGIREYIKYNTESDNKFTLLKILESLQPEYMGKIEYYEDKIIVMRSKQEFEITNASDTIKIILDIYKLPAKSLRNHIMVSPSIGYFHLTPVLYLVSNLGTTHFTYAGQECVNQKILMKINNRFKHGMPINAFNYEFYSKVNTSTLSDSYFQLVDANFKPVKLLSPLYISAIAIGIRDDISEALM